MVSTRGTSDDEGARRLRVEIDERVCRERFSRERMFAVRRLSFLHGEDESRSG